jgi:hypothetical protein
MAASRSAIMASAPARRSVSVMVSAAARAWSISVAVGGGQQFGDHGQRPGTRLAVGDVSGRGEGLIGHRASAG